MHRERARKRTTTTGVLLGRLHEPAAGHPARTPAHARPLLARKSTFRPERAARTSNPAQRDSEVVAPFPCGASCNSAPRPEAVPAVRARMPREGGLVAEAECGACGLWRKSCSLRGARRRREVGLNFALRVAWCCEGR